VGRRALLALCTMYSSTRYTLLRARLELPAMPASRLSHGLGNLVADLSGDVECQPAEDEGRGSVCSNFNHGGSVCTSEAGWGLRT
jgi:hypothetical protein